MHTITQGNAISAITVDAITGDGLSAIAARDNKQGAACAAWLVAYRPDTRLTDVARSHAHARSYLPRMAPRRAHRATRRAVHNGSS
jgi:hypothetical protein